MTRCRVPRRGAVPRLGAARPTKSQRPPGNTKEPLPRSTIDLLLVLLRDRRAFVRLAAPEPGPACLVTNLRRGSLIQMSRRHVGLPGATPRPLPGPLAGPVRGVRAA